LKGLSLTPKQALMQLGGLQTDICSNRDYKRRQEQNHQSGRRHVCHWKAYIYRRIWESWRDGILQVPRLSPPKVDCCTRPRLRVRRLEPLHAPLDAYCGNQIRTPSGGHIIMQRRSENSTITVPVPDHQSSESALLCPSSGNRNCPAHSSICDGTPFSHFPANSANSS
jgi:hypothetical protein